MADLNALASKYRSGEVTLEQLKSQYKLSTSDIEKIKQINAKIDKELGVKNEHQPLPGSIEITLDDGTKVLAVKINTVNQPKGGFVNVYMAQDGKQYYQYTDANGKQQKVTKVWDYMGATGENLEVAWNKLQDGHPWDALMTLMEGAEDPRGLNTGVAPAVGFSKGGGFVKSMKDFGKWLKQLKNIKSFEQFKSFAMGFLQKMKPTKQMKPSRNIPDGLDRNAQWSSFGKKGEKTISEAFRFGNAAERHQKTVLNSENTAKVVSHLSKQLNKTIDPKELKLVSLANKGQFEFKISYFDKASGQSFIFLENGTPEMVISYNYGITGSIKGANLKALWRETDKGWEFSEDFIPTKYIYDGSLW